MLPYLLSVLEVPEGGGVEITYSLFYKNISLSTTTKSFKTTLRKQACTVIMKFLHLNEVDTCSTVAVGRLGEKADEAICFRK